MLKNTTIFILSNAKYDGPFESTSYTAAKYLAQENKVYYIEYPATLKDYYKLKGTPDFIKKKAFYKRNSDGLLNTEIPGLKILLTPLLLSINFLPEGFIYRLLLKFNENLIANRIKKVVKKEQIDEFIFINSFNIYYPNIGKLIPSTLNVYHCVDPLIVGFDIKHGTKSEKIILKYSDLVICTSKQLYLEKKDIHPHTYFVPNAADISHSEKARDLNLKIHPKLLSIKKPVIGYFGNIERRMDYPLLAQLFKSNPDKSFVMVGPVTEAFIPEWWYKTSNVHLIGRVPFNDMPAILKGFDVAIIPFKKDEVSSTIFPLKLFEYLGSGKPVVCTNFNADLKEFTKDTVPYCDNETEFTIALNDSLLNDNEDKVIARIRIAEENTWEIRLKEFADLLSKYLKIKMQ
ncbi:MAG: glycosyltransferase [Candidatus Dojkabacteria bacterium]